MKKFISILCIGFITLSLAACSGLSSKAETRVKCPACGYEFDIEASS